MITILCSGSRGDIQPYIALAKELKNLGKEVRIATGKSFEAFVREYEIDFYPISLDYLSANVDKQLLEAAQSSDNPLKMLLTFNKMNKFVKDKAYKMLEEMYGACEGSELIVYHPGCAIGYFAAKKAKIPGVLASPFPIHYTNEFNSILTYGRYKLPKKVGYKFLQELLWITSKSGIKSYFKKHFGRLPDNFYCPFEHTTSTYPALVSCSNYVFSRPSDWNENIHQYGFWFLEEEKYIPDEGLVDFIGKGEKPIYFGFGSVFNGEDKAWFVDIIKRALEDTGQRGIISGMGKIDTLPEYMYCVDSIPHSWLFKNTSAVCHHGGVGTTAEGFRAGVPSIIIPFSNDQFGWAYRAYDIGVGAYPIPRKKLNSDQLSKAIKEVKEEEVIKKAKELGVSIEKELGALKCAKVIAEILE